MSTAPALSIRGLNKSFGAIVVAQSIDVDLKPGARVGLIGPNGAGKTTFVNLLTGFLKPDSGTINLEGTSDRRHGAGDACEARPGAHPPDQCSCCASSTPATISPSRSRSAKTTRGG